MSGTMRRAVVIAPKKVEVQELPIPNIKPDEVLVRVGACAICTWEQRVYTGQMKMYPFVGGHEVAGTAAQIGSDVEVLGLGIGDPVAVSALKICGQCYACRHGYTNICDNIRTGYVKGQPMGPGGLAEYMVVPGYQVYKTGLSLPVEQASLAEPLGCVIKSIKRANVKPGDHVVVIGGGFMGMLHVMLARQRGAVVIVSEPNAVRLEKAVQLGADFAINPVKEDFAARVKEITNGQGAEVVIIAVSVPRVVEDAVSVTAKGGLVSCYSSFHPRDAVVSLPINRFHHHEVTLTGSMSRTPEDFWESVAVLSQKRVDLDPLISRIFPLERVEEAFEAAISLDTYRVVVTMQ